MIGLDTNILVRYLTQDDRIQSPRANYIIDRLTEAQPRFISIVAVGATGWVLARAYGLSNHEIARVIERILQGDTLVVQNEQEVFTAMTSLKTDAGSFSDALIAALGGWAGCRATLTFDRKAARLPRFELA